MLANKVKRIRIRASRKSAAERAYDLAYKGGYNTGRLEQQVEYLDQIRTLKRAVASWNTDYDALAMELSDSKDEVEFLQKQNSDLYETLDKAEIAREHWRRQVRELLFDAKRKNNG